MFTKRPRFIIALEGIDGSGKTTQCKLLRNYLKTQGIKARAIGRRFIGSTLLTLICKTDVIIADKYTYTIKVYFCHKGIKSKLFNGLFNFLPKPNIVFYLNADASLALERIASRAKKRGKYETEEGLLIFAQGYDTLFSESCNMVYKLNAFESVEQIHEKIAHITLLQLFDFKTEH
ncbi:MAG: hypothetical protein FWG63_09195 [Defluviitaleaceae bacterium]|nr:hypothetical protein [Defluviitaleaceae bacterium]